MASVIGTLVKRGGGLNTGLLAPRGAFRASVGGPSDAVYPAAHLEKDLIMTLCPIAIVAGCKKCPAFSVCPLKSVIGDVPKAADLKSAPPQKKK